MRRALFILVLIIGMMGVMLPVQAHDGSDDGDDSRNESVGTNHNDDDDRAEADDDDDEGNGENAFSRRIWLSGKNEVPVADLDGSGWAEISSRPSQGTVCYRIKVRKLDPVTAAHIHVGGAGVNGGIVIDLSILTAQKNVWVSSIVYKACVTGVATSLINTIKANPAAYYVNVHTTVFPGGAIRGQLR
jgi:hypothetical protein